MAEGITICYGDLLTEGDEKRAVATEKIISALKDAASSALRNDAGGEAVLSFVTNHGPCIVQYAHGCPFADVSASFSDLLEWLRKTYMLEIEDMLEDDDEVSDSCDHSQDVDADRLQRDRRRGSRKANGGGLFRNGSGQDSVFNDDVRPADDDDDDGASFSGCSSASNGHAAVGGAPRRKWRNRPCSRFIPVADVEPVLTTHPQVSRLYKQAFLAEGEVPNWVRILSLKTEMALKLHNGWTNVMSKGPLAAEYRWYVALMTAALNKSDYWVERCELSFLNAGGCEDWLVVGVESNPKLAAYVSFNKLLSTAPWLLTAEHVTGVVESGKWTLPELVQAVVISSQMLAFCSIAKGTGCVPESVTTLPPDSLSMTDNFPAPGEVTDLLDALNDSNDPLPGTTPLEAFSVLVEEDAAEEECSTSVRCTNDERMHLISGEKASPRFSGFRREDSRANYLKLSEYNWKDDACCVVDQLLDGGLASQLDDTFFTVTTMTDNDIFGNVRGIDTTRLRRMVWYYVHGLYGIQADDMDYTTINFLVGIKKEGIKMLKRYIKYVGCMAGDIRTIEYRFDYNYAQVRPTHHFRAHSICTHTHTYTLSHTALFCQGQGPHLTPGC